MDHGPAPVDQHAPPHMQQQQQQGPPQPPPPPGQAQSQASPPSSTASSSSRKRKKADNGEPAAPAEPRRLRRSHEACARCRNKKIKCDSKHPRCTACATAGTPCHQEDRHRQTLTPRGYTERLERQLAQCDALLKHHVPGFDMAALDDFLAKAGLPVDPAGQDGAALAASAAFQFQSQSPNGFPPPPPPPPGHMLPPGYPGPLPPYAYPPPGPPGAPPYPPHMMPPPHMYPPIHPAFQQPPPGALPPPPPQAPNSAQPSPPHPHHHQASPPPQAQQQQQQQSQQQQQQQHPPESIQGADPRFNNLADDRTLAQAFGVSPPIIQGLKLGNHEVEDMAIHGGLVSGRDRAVAEAAEPRDPAKWVQIGGSGAGALWLPKDREMANKIVGVYFERLNFHRPVFLERDFVDALDGLYRAEPERQYDPGFVCAVYLVLALGTLSELSHRACGLDRQAREKHEPAPPSGSAAAMNAVRKLMPPDWPEHEELFHRALAVKPELRVTVSSLQALILLHWYLYTERQGRTLWRLVGSLVRLGIELGLNHDPTTQPIFSEPECRQRIRLWGIVLVHDRGTSIQLGRPLAIAPNDSSTPQPTAPRSGEPEFSDHFLYSPPIAEIQADIIQSLYSPQVLTADQIHRHATRIVKSMVEFRSRLPDRYRCYFGGTDDWPLDRRYRLVQDISADDGLTLLKIGITRVLLLRALFSSKDLHYPQRRRALVDAILVSHNIIVVHHHLIRFPDIAFFVSPIPLHIAAMVILYGHMSRCDALPRQVALEDVWMALDMLPSFRWRWERKDHNGGHPLIARLAEKVLEVNLHQAGPTAQPILLPEMNWDGEFAPNPPGALLSPVPAPSVVSHMPMQTPYYGAPTSGGGGVGGGGGMNGNGSGNGSGNGMPGTPSSSASSLSNGGGAGGSSAAMAKNGGANGTKMLPDVDPALFYPYFDAAGRTTGAGPNAGEYAGILDGGGPTGAPGAPASAAAWGGAAGHQYMLEEKDVQGGWAGQ